MPAQICRRYFLFSGRALTVELRRIDGIEVLLRRGEVIVDRLIAGIVSGDGHVSAA